MVEHRAASNSHSPLCCQYLEHYISFLEREKYIRDLGRFLGEPSHKYSWALVSRLASNQAASPCTAEMGEVVVGNAKNHSTPHSWNGCCCRNHGNHCMEELDKEEGSDQGLAKQWLRWKSRLLLRTRVCHCLNACGERQHGLKDQCSSDANTVHKGRNTARFALNAIIHTFPHYLKPFTCSQHPDCNLKPRQLLLDTDAIKYKAGYH